MLPLQIPSRQAGRPPLAPSPQPLPPGRSHSSRLAPPPAEMSPNSRRSASSAPDLALFTSQRSQRESSLSSSFLSHGGSGDSSSPSSHELSSSSLIYSSSEGLEENILLHASSSDFDQSRLDRQVSVLSNCPKNAGKSCQTQTEAPTMVNAETSTIVVWELDGWHCKNCAKSGAWVSAASFLQQAPRVDNESSLGLLLTPQQFCGMMQICTFGTVHWC